ncbi:MAG TPA: peptidoglycan recognition family protein [Actinomycetota bacterium]|nr:peptidoglycan recognition family protein [Actinomycetota bacterium]
MGAAVRLGRWAPHHGPGRLPDAGSPQLLSAPGVSVIPRAGWGADESLRAQSPIFAPVRQLFVHHTVTDNGAPPIPTIQQIYHQHLGEGFIDVGYHFLIDDGGNVYEGRWSRDYPAGATPTGQNAAGMGVVGAHVANHDVGTMGIALLGTFVTALPTGSALNALLDVLAWLADLFGLDPMGTYGGEPVIAGHRDANQTACPGDQLYAQLPGLRQAVVNRIEANARNGQPLPPSCCLLVPGGVSAVTAPTVSGQVGRSAVGVDVTFAGASEVTVSAVPSAGAWSIGPSSYTLGLGGLSPGTYTVTAVARDATGKASPPTAVASGYRVVTGQLPSGYWVLGDDGGIFAYGAAQFFGSTGGMHLNAPVVGMAATPAGDGYWLVASDGGIFAYGAAGFHGSTGSLKLNKPIVGISTSPSGQGYRLVASDGGIFSFGDAQFYGSTGSIKLNKPIVGMAATPRGGGYWLVASDGGIFAFGDAGFYGSAGGQALAKPVVAIEPTPSGRGYWIVASDGAVFAYGDAPFHGSAPGAGIRDLDIVDMVATPTAAGYYLIDLSGNVLPFGDAPVYGSPLLGAYDMTAMGMIVRA